MSLFNQTDILLNISIKIKYKKAILDIGMADFY